MGLPRSPAQNKVGPGTGHLPNLPGAGWGWGGVGEPQPEREEGPAQGPRPLDETGRVGEDRALSCTVLV